MSKKNLSLALNIDLATSGVAKLAEGITEIKKAGVEVKELETGLNDLTRAFDDISNQQRLIAQFKSLKKESKELSTQLKNGAGDSDKLKARKKALAQQLKAVRADMDKAGIAVKGLSDKEKQLTSQSKAAEKALDNLNNEAKELKSIADAKIKLGLDTDEKARKELEAVTTAYKKLEKSGKLSSTELARANALHTQRVKELESQLVKTRPTLNEITADLGKFATAGAAFTLIAREAMQFESAMAGVKKVVDGTPEEMDALASEVKQLAQELGILPEQVAEIAAAGGQLGVALADLPDFIRLAGEISVAFDMTAEEAANAAAKLSNVWDIPLDQVRELGDAINTLGNNTAAREAEITAAMLRIGGNAKQFGLAAEQAAALADAMIALGKPPEVAATAINALLLKLQTGQSQGKAFKAALSDIGYSADEMAANIQANPQQALSDFLGKLRELDTQSRALALADLFGAEYADDISLLVGSLGEYEKALSLVEDKTKTTGALNNEFKAQMNKAETAVTQAKIAVSNLASTLGSTLLPIISATADGVASAANAVDLIAQQYPLLTELAVILAGAKLASLALKTTFKLLGVTGAKSATQIAVGFTGAKAKIDATAVSAKALNTQFATNAATAKGLAGKLANVANQLSLIAAAGVGGFAFGTALRESSPIVRDIGDELGRVIAYLDAMVTDRTFADVNQYFETWRERQARLAEETRKSNEAIAEQKRLQTEAAQATEQAAAREATAYRQAIETIDQLRNSMEALEASGETNSAHYRYLKEQITALQPVIDAYNQKLTESGKVLDNNVTKIREQEQATKAASDAFAALGVDVNKVMTGVSTDAQTAMTTFATAMDSVRAAGTENMSVTQAAIQAVLDTLSSPAEFAAFNKQLKATGDLAKATAEQQKALIQGQKKITEQSVKSTAVTKQKIQATQAETAATEKAAEATEKAAEATEKQAISTQKLYDTTNLTKEQMNDMVSLYEKYRDISYNRFLHGFDSDFRDEIRLTADAYREINDEIVSLDKKISDGSISVSDLSRAFVDAKNKAKSLDDVTMARMEAALDRAKAKIKELAETARSEVADLEAELASVKGDDTLSRKLEQKRKLAALEEKLAAARARNSREEIAAYERAIRLQQQIYNEKEKQIQAEEKRRNEQKKPDSDNDTSSRRGNNDNGGQSTSRVDINKEITGALSRLPPPQIDIDRNQLVNTFAQTLARREKQISEQVIKDIEQMLHDANRTARA